MNLIALKILMSSRTAAVIAMLAISSMDQSKLYAEELDGCPTLPTVERGHPQVPSVVGEKLFNEMIGWIAVNTSYDLSTVYYDPPTISFCGVGEVIRYEQSDLLVDVALLAVFDRERRHIFLTQPWAFMSYFDQSVLLHELIHDAQLQTQDWECPGAMEREAYLLQDKWLFEHGVSYSFDWALIRQLSDCGDSN